jgi:hypothetical protein
MMGPGGIVGYRSEPDTIWMMIPAAAATIPVTFSLPAADSVGRLLVDSCIGVSFVCPTGSGDVAVGEVSQPQRLIRVGGRHVSDR